MELKKREEKGVTIFSAAGRVDGVNAHELSDYLAVIVEEGQSNLVLNFSELKYISSAGLRVILTTVKLLKAKKRDLFLSQLAGPVKDVFKLSGFYAILKTFETDAEAVDAC
ncbi:MAG: STAS domain-containing protein [Desulfobacter sp.]|nr:STAS domain-containing protein [Desulfobacter sp.]